MLTKSERTFYFIRHGVTRANQNKLWCGGEWDIELSEEGRRQAQDLSEKIVSISSHFDKIFCSPMIRAAETANIINSKINKQIEIVENLREWKIGTWEKTPWQPAFSEVKLWDDPPGGEPIEQFKKRVTEVMNYCLEKSSNPVIVSHGVLGKILVQHLKIQEPHILNCTIYKIYSYNDEHENVCWKLEKI